MCCLPKRSPHKELSRFQGNSPISHHVSPTKGNYYEWFAFEITKDPPKRPAGRQQETHRGQNNQLSNQVRVFTYNCQTAANLVRWTALNSLQIRVRQQNQHCHRLIKTILEKTWPKTRRLNSSSTYTSSCSSLLCAKPAFDRCSRTTSTSLKNSSARIARLDNGRRRLWSIAGAPVCLPNGWFCLRLCKK